MNSLEVLKRIPQEHYTQYNNKCILVKDLVKIIEEEIKKERKVTESKVKGKVEETGGIKR